MQELLGDSESELRQQSIQRQQEIVLSVVYLSILLLCSLSILKTFALTFC